MFGNRENKFLSFNDCSPNLNTFIICSSSVLRFYTIEIKNKIQKILNLFFLFVTSPFKVIN